MEEAIEHQLAHSLIIDALIGKLENEDQVLDRQLAAFLQKLLRTISAFSRKEPAVAARLETLMAETACFQERVRLFQTRTQPLLLDALKNIFAERKAARHSGFVGSKNVRSMQILVRKYREALYFYHDVFTGLVEGESEKMGKVMVVSSLGNCLLNLTALIKTRISAIETAFNCLGEWKIRLRLAEAQAFYN